MRTMLCLSGAILTLLGAMLMSVAVAGNFKFNEKPIDVPTRVVVAIVGAIVYGCAGCCIHQGDEYLIKRIKE